MRLDNAAVFQNGKRIVRNVDVEWDDEGNVKVISRGANKPVLMEYSTQELASTRDDSMAWDVVDDSGTPWRLVAQTGCGCSGIKPYVNDESYSGPLTP